MTGTRMKGKVALITAGARGIGKATAERFLAEDTTVAICDMDEAALATMKEAYPSIVTYQLNVSDEDAVKGMISDIHDKFGQIDALVNNAGVAGQTGPIEEQEVDAWRQCMAVNVEGTMLTMKYVAPIMKSQKSGAVINISSTAGIMGYPYRSPYAASKWAVIGLAKTWAMELGEDNIRVNTICPGSVDGDRMVRVIAAEAETTGLTSEAIRASYEKQTSMRTFIVAEDIANAALFMCSDEGRFVSGQVFGVDGAATTLDKV
ncbi:SDR family NAD(P)-dependent oxidoreductase [Curvivirga aplysinae]|uniref:SDR family NAD(P)-dependent oxidoreductase n=1 Tax=Curvivirga aplysinae TaxID=2529852 RepID=UPI0012BC0865|nr:SDR family oxidoreductase [Curvivirga aplysinae]MTI08759.1 SDR family oxidoreductase [Curvivirga aplysinae]